MVAGSSVADTSDVVGACVKVVSGAEVEASAISVVVADASVDSVTVVLMPDVTESVVVAPAVVSAAVVSAVVAAAVVDTRVLETACVVVVVSAEEVDISMGCTQTPQAILQCTNMYLGFLSHQPSPAHLEQKLFLVAWRTRKTMLGAALSFSKLLLVIPSYCVRSRINVGCCRGQNIQNKPRLFACSLTSRPPVQAWVAHLIKGTGQMY